MLREMRQVLRLIMLLAKQRRRRGVKPAGGLLFFLRTETGASFLSCTVAAAGPWFAGIKVKALEPELKECLFSYAETCPEPDPEELCDFTDLYGSLRLIMSFQIKDTRLFSPEGLAHLQAYLHTFSLANAKITIHLKFKSIQQTLRQEFRVKIKSKVAQAGQPSLILDVTCNTQPPASVIKGRWCQGGHPVLGEKLPLSIPPQVIDQGLFGEVSVELVTLLSPCVLQYPNLATQVTQIQVFVYSPSNLPVTGSTSLCQILPSHLDCEELGLYVLHWSSQKASSADHVHSTITVYTIEEENWEHPEKELDLPLMQQSLQLFLFLHHSDPFTSQLSDDMAAETLIEHHLEDILINNRRAFTAAVQTEIKNTLKAQNRRKKDQEKLHTAVRVILSSSISIVRCSSNTDFRNACLNSMKVHDTQELSASLCESLKRVISWKFTSKDKCYSVQSDEPTRTEI